MNEITALKQKLNIINRTFNQYKYDVFEKLGFDFSPGKALLDAGCGGCSDTRIFRDIFGLDAYALDIYENENVKKYGINFILGSIFELPYKSGFFDYVFVHDVLHHIDEEKQSKEQHIKALENLKRVTKPGGYVIIVEANRYNILTYPHMVKMMGHNHFTYNYFKELVSTVFSEPTFISFEAHLYPSKFYWLFKIYDSFMDKFSPKIFKSYNAAVIRIKK